MNATACVAVEILQLIVMGDVKSVNTVLEFLRRIGFIVLKPQKLVT